MAKLKSRPSGSLASSASETAATPAKPEGDKPAWMAKLAKGRTMEGLVKEVQSEQAATTPAAAASLASSGSGTKTVSSPPGSLNSSGSGVKTVSPSGSLNSSGSGVKTVSPSGSLNSSGSGVKTVSPSGSLNSSGSGVKTASPTPSLASSSSGTSLSSSGSATKTAEPAAPASPQPGTPLIIDSFLNYIISYNILYFYFYFYFINIFLFSGAGTSIVRSYADLKARVNVDDLDLTQLEVRREAGGGLYAVANVANSSCVGAESSWPRCTCPTPSLRR
jgi:hypothetical protein